MIELMPTELMKDQWVNQHEVYEGDWWVKKYWNSTEGSQRDAIIKALEQIGEFASVLELGCNTGPNLRRIHKRWPLADLSGMDINPLAIKFGREAAQQEGWNWSGYCGDLRDLHLLRPASADVVLTCYSLAYLDPRDIDGVLAAALACASRALVICEPLAPPEGEGHAPQTSSSIAEYHYAYQERLAPLLRGSGATLTYTPILSPQNRLQHVLTVLK